MSSKALIPFLTVMLLINASLTGRSGNGIHLQNFFVGTYTDSGSEGIYSFSLDPVSGKLVAHGLAAKSDNPSFLALSSDGKFLLAINEIIDERVGNKGYIESFEVAKDSECLIPVNKVSSGGPHPCYVAVNQERSVLVANYSGGNVALFHLGESGKLSEAIDIQQHSGSGPNLERQKGPHVHSAFFEPGSNRIFVSDLGIDKVLVYQIDRNTSRLIKAPYPAINLPPGSGPRHLAFHPTLKLVYVVNELFSSVSAVRLNNDGSFNLLETVSALPSGCDKPNTCADIHITKDGRFLYVSNRGFNSIAIFAIDPESGRMSQIAQEPTRGETPRNFTLSPSEDFLLVGNQTTQDIVAFRRDTKTGQLYFTDQIKAFKPICLLFHN
jgi:6-phosphogluconolactonase